MDRRKFAINNYCTKVQVSSSNIKAEIDSRHHDVDHKQTSRRARKREHQQPYNVSLRLLSSTKTQT